MLGLILTKVAVYEVNFRMATKNFNKRAINSRNGDFYGSPIVDMHLLSRGPLRECFLESTFAMLEGHSEVILLTKNGICHEFSKIRLSGPSPSFPRQTRLCSSGGHRL